MTDNILNLFDIKTSEPQLTSSHEKSPLNTNGHSKILGNRYLLNDIISVGGIGVIYLAIDLIRERFKDENKHVAIKIPTSDMSSFNDILPLWYGEYSNMEMLRHENIIKALDFGIDEHSKLPYIVLEYVKGLNLFEHLTNPLRSIPHKQKPEICLKLAKAVQSMHDKGLIHNDITPSNVLILNHDVVLIDFGVSTRIGKRQPNFLLNYKKISLKLNSYMAPEIINHHQLPTLKSDYYSLCSTIYHIISENKIDDDLSHLKKIPISIRNIIRGGLYKEERERSLNLPKLITRLSKMQTKT